MDTCRKPTSSVCVKRLAQNWSALKIRCYRSLSLQQSGCYIMSFTYHNGKKTLRVGQNVRQRCWEPSTKPWQNWRNAIQVSLSTVRMWIAQRGVSLAQLPHSSPTFQDVLSVVR